MKKVDLVTSRKGFLTVVFGVGITGLTLMLSCIIGFSLYYSGDLLDGGVQVSILFIGVFIFYFLCCLSLGYGYIIQIEIDETEFRSVWFKRNVCTVKRTEKIYYIFFDAHEDLSKPIKQFVLLSNRKINGNNIAISPVINNQFKRYVILPYNSETKPYLDLDNWTCSGLYLKTL